MKEYKFYLAIENSNCDDYGKERQQQQHNYGSVFIIINDLCDQ